MEEQNTKRALLKETDLLQVVTKIISRRKFIFKMAIISMIFGLIVALSSIKSYTAETVVAPETNGSSMLKGGGLGSIASMIGFDMGALSGNDAIYPMLYPDIIKSLPFLSSLFNVNVVSLDGTVDTTYYHYIRDYQKTSWFGEVKAVPKKIMKLLENILPSKQNTGDPSHFDPYNLSKTQMSMIETLSSSIKIFVDKKTNVITLSYTDQDPLVAAMMTDTIMARLQQRITEYRTKKAMGDCAYIEQMYNDAKNDYEQAQNRYAEYVDRNRNVTQERFLVEKERLEADKELKNMLYNQWAQQLLLAKAKVQENTPAFTTVKPAAVPALPSSTRKLMIIFMYTFFGVSLAVAYVLLKEPVVNTYNKLFRNKK